MLFSTQLNKEIVMVTFLWLQDKHIEYFTSNNIESSDRD